MDLPAIFGYAAATFIVTRAGIFRWIREIGPRGWRDFITCPLCTGFWVGAGLGLAKASLQHLVPWNRAELQNFTAVWAGEFLLELVVYGALTGTVALLYTAVLDALPMPPKPPSLPKLPRISYPDEAPTDPNGYAGPTKRVSDSTIEEAMRRMKG